VVVRRGSRLKLRQRIDDLVLAGLGDHPERLGVLWGVLAVRFETPVRLPRFGCGVRVHVLEIVDDRFQRLEQAVNVESEEADSVVLVEELVVYRQPVKELEYFPVRPHPVRPPVEGFQDLAVQSQGTPGGP